MLQDTTQASYTDTVWVLEHYSPTSFASRQSKWWRFLLATPKKNLSCAKWRYFDRSWSVNVHRQDGICWRSGPCVGNFTGGRLLCGWSRQWRNWGAPNRQVHATKLPPAICIFLLLRSMPLSYQRELTAMSSLERCGSASIWAINAGWRHSSSTQSSLHPSSLFLALEDETLFHWEGEESVDCL